MDLNALDLRLRHGEGRDWTQGYDQRRLVPRWAATPALQQPRALHGVHQHRRACGRQRRRRRGRVLQRPQPFRFTSYILGDRLQVTRNEGYWGEKPEWASISDRMISNDGARAVPLIAGEVDFIDQIPTADPERLRGDDRFGGAKTTSLRVMCLTLDAERAKPVQQMAAADGGALDRHPLIG